MSRNAAPKGFISEHTAEYALVPELLTILRSRYSLVIPIYYLATREGTAASVQGLEGCPVRLLTVFPRRPKVSPRDPTRIWMKLNAQILSYAKRSWQDRLPVIAGMPLARALRDLRSECECAWIDISCIDEGAADDTFPIPALRDHSGRWRRIDSKDILRLVAVTPETDWETLSDTMRTIRSDSRIVNAGPFGAAYRPFYILIGR